ncbi:MAG: hypothetical protein ACRC0S_02215 [Fusobacteriaceae bacterium]
MAINKEAINKLKNSLIVTKYQSTFDFATFEIEKEVALVITENESVIATSLNRIRKATLDVCTSLYNTSVILKPHGCFMEWYEQFYTKDEVSILMRRYELYLNYPDFKEYIFSLSDAAIKEIKRITDETIILEIMNLKLRKLEDIRKYLIVEIPISEKENEVVIKIESNFSYKIRDIKEDFKTELETVEDTTVLKKDLNSLKKIIKELEEFLEEKELKNTNKNNLKLEGLNE